MKTLLTLIITVASAFAGTLTITTDPADDPRIAEAFGSILGLRDASGNPRPATEAEITDATAKWIGGQTHDYERRKDMAAFTPPPFSTGALAVRAAAPTPTPKKK